MMRGFVTASASRWPLSEYRGNGLISPTGRLVTGIIKMYQIGLTTVNPVSYIPHIERGDTDMAQMQYTWKPKEAARFKTHDAAFA